MEGVVTVLTGHHYPSGRTVSLVHKYSKVQRTGPSRLPEDLVGGQKEGVKQPLRSKEENNERERERRLAKRNEK